MVGTKRRVVVHLCLITLETLILKTKSGTQPFQQPQTESIEQQDRYPHHASLERDESNNKI